MNDATAHSYLKNIYDIILKIYNNDSKEKEGQGQITGNELVVKLSGTQSFIADTSPPPRYDISDFKVSSAIASKLTEGRLSHDDTNQETTEVDINYAISISSVQDSLSSMHKNDEIADTTSNATMEGCLPLMAT